MLRELQTIGAIMKLEEYLMKNTVSPQFRNYCLERYPALKTNQAYRKLFQYLMFGTFHDESTNNLIINSSKLAEFAGMVERNKSGNFKSSRFLQSFKAEVLPKFKWTEYEPFVDGQWSGKARQVIMTGFDADLEDLLLREIESLEPTDSVYFVSGEPYTARSRKKDKEQAESDYQLAKSTFQLNDSQLLIQTYMEQIPSITFTHKLSENKDAILEAINKIDNANSRATQMRILHSIKENAAVYYKPSERNRTARLFHASDCVVGLKKEVRHAFCKGWTEIDLVSSQFAILAQILNAPLAKAFLATGEDLWTYLDNSVFDESERDVKVHKALFKPIIYGLAFGSSKRTIKSELRKQNADPERLFKNPIIAELFERREAWFANIEHYGYVTDAWNNKIQVTKDRWIGAVAAAKIQSIELEIISSIFPVAERYKEDCKITIFQHDGGCVSFMDKSRKEKIMREFNEAITKRAAMFGVITRLEAKDL